MPQVKEIKTKIKTSQITGIIAATAAALGIGALIYFSVIANQQQLALQATLPVLEQEYLPGVEVIATPTITDPAQIAVYNESIQRIATGITPLIDTTAQQLNITPQALTVQTQQAILIQQAADGIVFQAAEIGNQGVAELDIPNYEVGTFQLQVQATALTALDPQASIEKIELPNPLTGAQEKSIAKIADTTANQVGQLVLKAAGDIAQKTGGNQQTIVAPLQAVVYNEIGKTVNFQVEGLNTEIKYVLVEATAEGQEAVIPCKPNLDPNIKGLIANEYLVYYFCPTDTNTCRMTQVGFTSQTDCERYLSETLDIDSACYSNSEACSTDYDKNPCAQRPEPEQVKKVFCENEQCLSRVINADAACPEGTCFNNAEECTDSGCEGGFTFQYCSNNSWVEESFPQSDVNEARVDCEDSNHVPCYLEAEDATEAYKTAKQDCTSLSINKNTNINTNTNTPISKNYRYYYCDQNDYVCKLTNQSYSSEDDCQNNFANIETNKVNQKTCFDSQGDCENDTQCPEGVEKVQVSQKAYYCCKDNICSESASGGENCFEYDINNEEAKNLANAYCNTACGQHEPYTYAVCKDQKCVEETVPYNAEPCQQNYSPEQCFEDINTCKASGCEPQKAAYYYCADNGNNCSSNNNDCGTNFEEGKCFKYDPNNLNNQATVSADCDKACFPAPTPVQQYTCKNDQCVEQTEAECAISHRCSQSPTNCCGAVGKEPEKTKYYYCDPNQNLDNCVETSEEYDNSIIGRDTCSDAKKSQCYSAKEKAACDTSCNPIIPVIEKKCDETLPNDPKCPINVVKKIIEPEKPITEIVEPKLAIESKINYRGLGRIIIKFWANSADQANFDYTAEKLRQDFKDNKLRVKFSDDKNKLYDILKVYQDPRNINKYYAIAYKLNIDNLWQKDDGIYKTKKYFYQVNSDNKKSDFFHFNALQRAGEAMYVKILLYNGSYDLGKNKDKPGDGGTIDINLSNKGVPADNKKIANKIKKFENGGVYFWIQNSKVSPYGLRTAMAGDQRFKQYYKILQNLKNKNKIDQAVKILYNYHDRLKPTNPFGPSSRYDINGVNYWVKQVQNGKLSFNSMITYVMLGTDEPRQNLEQFWGTGKIAKKKAETELSFVKALSRGITQMSDISRFSSDTKYPSTAKIRGDLRNSVEFRKLLQDVYKREGESGAISLLYIADLGRPVDPDGQPYYIDKFNKFRKEGLNPTEALNEIDKELTSSQEYKDALNRPIE